MKLFFFIFIQSLCNSVKPVYPQKIDNISLHLSLALSTLLSLPPLPPSAFLCTPPWWVQFLTRPHIQLVAKWIIHACSRSTVRQRGRKGEKREGEAKTAYERCYVYVCVCFCVYVCVKVCLVLKPHMERPKLSRGFRSSLYTSCTRRDVCTVSCQMIFFHLI